MSKHANNVASCHTRAFGSWHGLQSLAVCITLELGEGSSRKGAWNKAGFAVEAQKLPITMWMWIDLKVTLYDGSCNKMLKFPDPKADVGSSNVLTGSSKHIFFFLKMNLEKMQAILSTLFPFFFLKRSVWETTTFIYNLVVFQNCERQTDRLNFNE